MKKSWIVYAAIVAAAVGCKDPEPQFGIDFTDKVVDVTLAAANGQGITFTDLYPAKATYIPDVAAENLILMDKLKLRGFTETSRSSSNAPLAGTHTAIVTLRKADCRCEVSKTYTSTENIRQYLESETIRCRNTGLKRMP